MSHLDPLQAGAIGDQNGRPEHFVAVILHKQHSDREAKYIKLEAELKLKSDRFSMHSCWGSHLDPLQAGVIGDQNGRPGHFCGSYFAQTAVNS